MSAYTFLQVERIQGPRLTLTPLHHADLQPLAVSLISPTTWFSQTRGLNSPEAFASYFSPKIHSPACLTLVARNSEYAAMSTFQHPSDYFRKVEIGFTWVADRWKRSYVNIELKYLMLKHAFEEMKTNRVEFSVHSANDPSNAAMRRLGATFEGTLRKWRFLPGPIPDNGDRNMYSIIDDEWLSLRSRLEERLKVA